MKATTITLAALAGLVSSTTAQYFGVIAAHSASPIHLSPLSASGESIWIGKQTAAYCPKKVVGKKNCPKGKETNFAGGDGTLAMGAEVPGGQQVYIDYDTGALGYTQAHSASMPEGAITGGWTLTQGPSFGTLSHKRGLLACSVNDDAEEGPWQIYANLKHLTFGDECIGFDALTSNMTKPDAWEYT